MSRVDLLLQLYRLALQAPAEMRTDRLIEWLDRRGALLEGLQGGPPLDSLERALVALILHADQGTRETWMRWRQQIRIQMSAARGMRPGGGGGYG